MLSIFDITHNFSDKELAAMGYDYWQKFPNGEWAGILSMAQGKGRICYQLTSSGYEDCWCYESMAAALRALRNWDPEKDPEPTGWHRHPLSGRRRPENDPAQEYVMR